MTTGYRDVCEAKTKADMQAKFRLLLAEIVQKHGGTPESHKDTQLSSVVYFAGYYSPAVRKRVFDWLRAVHPIFGNTVPTPAKRAD